MLRPKPGRSQAGSGTDDSRIRWIAWQLAALTSLLLFVLVVAMSGAVYLKAKSDLLHPLQSALTARAFQEADQYEHPPPGPGGNRPGSRTGGPPSGKQRFGDEPVVGGVYVTDVNQHLKVERSSRGGPRGAKLPSSAEAHRVLTGADPRFKSIKTGAGTYLIYSYPLLRAGGIIGVVQTSMSETQYLDDLSSILQTLVVVGFLGLVAVALITALVVQRALRPIRISLRRQRDFVADAAHELRTPLTIIRSAAELGIDQADGGEQQRAEVTLKQAVHLTRLVSDLSLLTRADTGTVDFVQENLDFSELVREGVDDVVVLAEERAIHIDCRADDGINVIGDSGRLRQVLLVLLDNAVKHSQSGGRITVTLERVRKEAVLRVTDSGVGIAPEDLPHLFERFYKSDQARAEEGTGLGLAIAQSIIEAHGGRITAGNSAAGGAVLTVRLPAVAGRTGIVAAPS